MIDDIDIQSVYDSIVVVGRMQKQINTFAILLQVASSRMFETSCYGQLHFLVATFSQGIPYVLRP